MNSLLCDTISQFLFQLPFNANRASSVEKYLKKSLENLQLNYIDLYLIHAPFGMQEGDEILPKDKDGKILLDPTTDHVLLWKVWNMNKTDTLFIENIP